MLCAVFRSPDEIATLLAAIPELAWLADGLKDGTEQRAELYRRLMCMSQQAVNDLLDPLLVRLESETIGAVSARTTLDSGYCEQMAFSRSQSIAIGACSLSCY